MTDNAALFKSMLRKNMSQKVEIPDAEFEQFVAIFEERGVQRGEFLLHRGDVAKETYFVINGCLKMFSIDAQGSEHVVQFGIEDWWVTDMNSIVMQKPAFFCIQAVERSTVFVMQDKDMEAIFEVCPKVERYFRILSTRRFIALQERVYKEHALLAEERYLEFVERFPSLLQRIPQHDIASYLGIKPQSLSRIRKNIYLKR